MQTKDSLNVDQISEIGQTITNATDNSTSIWLWIALIELIIIGFLLYKIKVKKTILPLSEMLKNKIKESQKVDIDMNNVMNSINGSRDLYKELSKVCHPDNFINTNKQELAEKLFKEITKNKRNFKGLVELKNEARENLNINFKN